MGKKENQLSKNDAVCTPASIFEPCLDAFGIECFDLDPCSHPASIIPARRHVLLPQYNDGNPNLQYCTFGDGLAVDWTDKVVWENPPYSQLQYPKKYPWLHKLATEARRGVAFLPVRTSSGWWHDGVLNCSDAHILVQLRGRVTHVGEKYGAPFHQCLVAYNVFGSQPAEPGGYSPTLAEARRELRGWRKAFPSAFVLDLRKARK